MRYVLRYTKSAQDDLARLDARTAGRIIRKLDYYIETPDPMRYAKRLSGGLRGGYRFRIGEYRAIFEISEEGVLMILEITRIGHRKDIYDRVVV